MTNRENFLNFIKGEHFERVPYSMSICEQLRKKLREWHGIEDYADYFDIPFRNAGIKSSEYPVDYKPYYIGKDVDFISEWGCGHKFGSVEHFTRFIPAMDNFTTIEEVNAFPLPDVLAPYRWEGVKERVQHLKDLDFVVMGNAVIDIFEPAWYLRGMENLLMDFYTQPDFACACLDRIKNTKKVVAQRLAQAGVDVIIYGDDVAMQTGMMMSPDIWREFLKPRLKEVLDAAHEVNPNCLCYYHTDGDARAIIPELIEIGVDILNPVQPECMDPIEIYRKYKDKVAFWGGIGTQTTMPFGSVEDVKEKVSELINLTKESGRFVIAPTHLLEPEVPLENIFAFVETLK